MLRLAKMYLHGQVSIHLEAPLLSCEALDPAPGPDSQRTSASSSALKGHVGDSAVVRRRCAALTCDAAALPRRAGRVRHGLHLQAHMPTSPSDSLGLPAQHGHGAGVAAQGAVSGGGRVSGGAVCDRCEPGPSSLQGPAGCPLCVRGRGGEGAHQQPVLRLALKARANTAFTRLTEAGHGTRLVPITHGVEGCFLLIHMLCRAGREELGGMQWRRLEHSGGQQRGG
jgi:hypothetical protein